MMLELVVRRAMLAQLVGTPVYCQAQLLINHEEFDPQDMRNMGGLASKMPVTSIAMMLGSMSIIGIPLVGGF